MIIRRAKALKILAELPVTIRAGEIVGSLTVTPHSTQIYPEYSNSWLQDEFDRLNLRKGDRFTITDEAKQQLDSPIWLLAGKRRMNWLHPHMLPETLDCMAENVFTVGNYYFNGVGHIAVDYSRVLARG
jgi:formate C-acetyltransferase